MQDYPKSHGLLDIQIDCVMYRLEFQNRSVLHIHRACVIGNETISKESDVLQENFYFHLKRNIIHHGNFRDNTMIFLNANEIEMSSIIEVSEIMQCFVPNQIKSTEQQWGNAINVEIIFENSCRFKDDPEYGKIMNRHSRDCRVICDPFIYCLYTSFQGRIGGIKGMFEMGEFSWDTESLQSM